MLLVSDVIEKDIKFVEDKLAPNLDYTSRAIKNWEHLACTEEVKAPLETRLRCKLNNQYCSRTQMLIDFLAAEMTHITVQDLIAALKAIKRNDVVEIITAVYPGMFNQCALSLLCSNNSTDTHKMMRNYMYLCQESHSHAILGHQSLLLL